MPAPVSENLHLINDHLREALASWAKPAGDPGAFQNDALPCLLTKLNSAAELLSGIVAADPADLELQKEISDYRANVEQLQKLLPLIHERLLAEKARLENARAHLHAAAAWAEASNKLL
jgi:hypothetical protein